MTLARARGRPGARPATAPDLSVVVVSWNTVDDLRACLGSVVRRSRRPPRRGVVVDNDSDDGSADMVEAEFPAVRWCATPPTSGSPPACNVGLAVARGRNVLLLNPDTVVLGDVLPATVAYLDATTRRGGARVPGPRHRRARGPHLLPRPVGAEHAARRHRARPPALARLVRPRAHDLVVAGLRARRRRGDRLLPGGAAAGDRRRRRPRRPLLLLRRGVGLVPADPPGRVGRALRTRGRHRPHVGRGGRARSTTAASSCSTPGWCATPIATTVRSPGGRCGPCGGRSRRHAARRLGGRRRGGRRTGPGAAHAVGRRDYFARVVRDFAVVRRTGGRAVTGRLVAPGPPGGQQANLAPVGRDLVGWRRSSPAGCRRR